VLANRDRLAPLARYRIQRGNRIGQPIPPETAADCGGVRRLVAEVGRLDGVPADPDPLTQQTHALLRRAVLDFRVAEKRKAFAPVVHVGVPGTGDLTYEPPRNQPLEHGLRADLVAALLRATRTDMVEPLVWVTRTGEFVLEDADAAWLSAARSAYAEAGVPLTMVVVTRRGWWDPRSGRSRVWKRLRRR
jgi:hypothetical protein